jgi:enamine deaminase RidA (YjgF/YER057c/UK114 family)
MSIVSFKSFNLCLALLVTGTATLGIPGPAHGQEPGLQALNPSSLPPAHGYSHVVIAPSGRLVSISGQVSIDSTGAVIGEGNFMAQCVQVFENLRRALRSVGLTFAHVVRTDMFVTDLDHLPALRECRARYLSAEDPPTSTLLQIDALLRPELMLEIAVEAVLPDASEAESVQQ